jgi:HEAT repeat protein
MMPAIPLEPLTDGVLALAGGVILLLLGLLVERGIDARRIRRAKQRDPVLNSLVYRVVQGDPATIRELHTISRFDRRLVRGILLRLALDLRGESGDAIATLYRELGFLAVDLRRLASWRASVRAHAAADLGLIQSSDALACLLQCLNDPAPRVRQTAVWAVGQVGGPEELSGLITLLGDSDRVVARRAQEVLVERGRVVASAILAYAARTSNRNGRMAAVELIGWLRIAAGSNLLILCMSDLDPEVRIKSVKAAAAIGDPAFVPSFHQALTDPRWEVRCQAAKGLSSLGSSESVARLKEALRDEHWWVRFYAATALAEIAGPGESVLQAALADAQQEVREMARYLLERGEAVPALP